MEGLSSSSFSSSSSSSSSSLLYRPVVTSNFSQCEGKPVHLGIDEAGRGCVLGPMVYACFYSPIDEEKKLTSQLRVDDSKKLKKSQREEIYEDLITKHRNSFGWSIHAIRPEEISAKMLRKCAFTPTPPFFFFSSLFFFSFSLFY
ncbi:ribonuclease h1 large subunit [Cystoisospora suis]|uniref:Ribonuclease n=1 Tax=Cystoisospora suis TaxID=483139 RepID=A0A2C6LD36_9APIC|nr:ribonuclease h1 large subunit [Cystoisospora suis]